MNLLAAATIPPLPQSTPAYQNPGYQGQGYQSTTTQPDKPAPKHSWVGQSIVVFNLLFNYIVVIIVVVLIYKFVKSFQKIADRVDNGIVIKKDDTTT